MEMLGTPQVTTVGGVPIAWSELGKGPPVILLHGLGDSHRTWRRTAPRLARNFRVILPDLPGHGLSGRPDAPYTLEWYAQVVTGFIDALDLDRTHVVGHSFGGGVAQWLLLRAPSRIDRMVLVAPGGLSREVSLGLRLASFPIIAPVLAPHLMGVGTRVMLRTGSELLRAEDDEIDRSAWLNAAPGSARAFCRTVSGCIDMFGQTVQAWDHLHDVPQLPPMKVVWGARDRIVPFRHAVGAAASRIEGAAFVQYDRSGHFPHLEESARFGEEVALFLDPSIAQPRPRVRPLPVLVRRPGPWRRLVVAMRRAVRARLRALAA